MKRLFSTKYSAGAFNFAILFLRVMAGLTLAVNHGYDKLMKFSTLSSRFADPFHIGHSLSLSLVIFAEFFCALFVVLGLFTRLACVPIIISMTVALATVHHFHIFGDGELPGIYLAIFVAILFVGPGRASADTLIGK